LEEALRELDGLTSRQEAMLVTVEATLLAAKHDVGGHRTKGAANVDSLCAAFAGFTDTAAKQLVDALPDVAAEPATSTSEVEPSLEETPREAADEAQEPALKDAPDAVSKEEPALDDNEAPEADAKEREAREEPGLDDDDDDDAPDAVVAKEEESRREDFAVEAAVEAVVDALVVETTATEAGHQPEDDADDDEPCDEHSPSAEQPCDASPSDEQPSEGASAAEPEEKTFAVRFDLVDSLGFSVALMRDRDKMTTHVIVDKTFESCPAKGHIQVFDELVALDDEPIAEVDSEAKFDAVVAQIRTARPVAISFHRLRRRYLEANLITDDLGNTSVVLPEDDTPLGKLSLPEEEEEEE